MSSQQSQDGRVFDGRSFRDVHPAPNRAGRRGREPVPPTRLPRDDGNKGGGVGLLGGGGGGTIFVSIPQFRDGRRCGRTLRRLFASARDPDRITVGLIEQTDTSDPRGDPTCLLEYCALMGHAPRGDIPPGVEHKAERQRDLDRVMRDCPRASDQVRSVRFHHLSAKGPVFARSFTRRVLGDEEFCMAIDSSADFAEGWDELAIGQWTEARNEYAVLSAVPSRERRRRQGEGGQAEVPRQCSIKIGSEGVPLYENRADGKAVGLKRPLLSSSISSSFTFAKCHYETNVPSDPFAAQLLETERFPRFARLWTRGYDVYTPALNVVYRDETELHPLHGSRLGHGDNGERHWPRNDGERRGSHVRMKVLLGLHHGVTGGEVAGSDGGDAPGNGGGLESRIAAARANLGIYGLGRRRTLGQLLDFSGIALPGPENSFVGRGNGNAVGGGASWNCADLAWVPYDASVPARANLLPAGARYEADDVDPDPVFPLRTLPDASGEQYEHPFPEGNAAYWDGTAGGVDGGGGEGMVASPGAPGSLSILLLWFAGLCVWYCIFVTGSAAERKRRRARLERGGSRRRRTKKGVVRATPLGELKNI